MQLSLGFLLLAFLTVILILFIQVYAMLQKLLFFFLVRKTSDQTSSLSKESTFSPNFPAGVTEAKGGWATHSFIQGHNQHLRCHSIDIKYPRILNFFLFFNTKTLSPPYMCKLTLQSLLCLISYICNIHSTPEIPVYPLLVPVGILSN